jgi:hypothetical protein
MTMTCPRAVAYLVIRKHHLGRCLHIFTMATVLERDNMIPVNFTSGAILALKPTPLAKAPASYQHALSLYNEKGDTLLQIWFSPGVLFFNYHAHRSLGDGWGKPQVVDMTQVNLNGGSVLDVTISIHYYPTESDFGRYQILFNGTTIAHFEKRFPGPATQIGYWVDTLGGPRSWFVDVYQIDDLLPEERLILGPGR